MGNTENIVIRNAHILFRNFAGRATQYNKDGSRNFCVVIDDPDYAQRLADEGWNIRILAPRDESDEPKHYLPVEVGFKYRPPQITLVTGRKKTPLNESTVGVIDFADIVRVNLSIRPRQWEVNGKSGIKAYLKTMYVEIEEDEFADMYPDEPEDR